MALSAWTITGAKPEKLLGASVGLEKDLEAWIAADPSLVDQGFVVLKQQLNLGAAGRLDLLCVDQQGRLVVVEIKRGILIRETIAQGIDYASVIAGWSAEMIRSQIDESVITSHADHPGVGALLQAGEDDDSREVEIVIVGCGGDPGIDRMLEFLGSTYSVPIRAVTFDVFTLADGHRILVREEREAETPPKQAASQPSVDGVIARVGGADSPNGRRMLAIVEAGERNGLYARPYKWSIMLAPPQKRTRYLATVWRVSDTQIVLTYSADAFAEFFPVAAKEVSATLGAERLDFTTDEEPLKWGRRLDALFESMTTDGDGDGGNGDDPQQATKG
jgi:hypothetical protein